MNGRLGMTSHFRLSTLLAACAVAAALVPAAPSATEAQEADPADVESIDAIITAVYDVISGEAGEARDWDRWHTLFTEGATLSPTGRRPDGSVGRTIWTPESYIERAGASLEQNGFFEKEIGRVAERFGVIAHAFSTYESYRSERDAEPFARGINSFQLMHDGNRWWVVSIFWMAESPEFPIPEMYIGGVGDSDPETER